MRIVNIYNPRTRDLIGSYNVRDVYEDTFYHKEMPTLNAKTCREILNILYPHVKANNILLLFEWDDTKYRGIQPLYRKGTVLNF